VAEILGVLRSSTAEKKIDVESHVDGELTEVVVDAARFKQVLYNYVSNALKFTPAGGRVMVRMLATGATFRLEVTDTGIGIAPQDIPRLFTAFEQLDAGTRKRHAGTGLGLALVKRLVEAQGGTVGVTSTLGAGATFFATLPRRPDSSVLDHLR
jgi:signal transduction histidine kinase